MQPHQHVLRGEDATSHTLSFDRLPAEHLSKEALHLAVRGLHLDISTPNDTWHVDLPPDIDAHQASASLHPPTTLKLTFQKKQHNDTHEELQRMKNEALASNKMTVIPITDKQ